MTRAPLQDSERKYLKSRLCYPERRMVRDDGEAPVAGEKHRECPVDEGKAKYRIHNEVGRNLPEIIREFRTDLMAVNMFYMNIKKDGWYEYESVILPQAKDEMEQLRDHLNTLIEYADREMMDERREEVRKPVSSLSDGLEYLNRYHEGDVELLKQVERVDGEIQEPKQLAEEEEEYDRRKQALITVLSDDGLFEIFEWVCDNEKSKVPDRTKSNSKESWKQAIGKYLKSSHELVEEEGWGYELTDRGRAVKTCWEDLSEASVVETKLDTLGESRREVAWRLLNRYFDAEDKWG